MMYSRLSSMKLMPHFIQDFGVYNGVTELDLGYNMNEKSMHSPKLSENKKKSSLSKSNKRIIDYIKLLKEIKKNEFSLNELYNKKAEIEAELFNVPTKKRVLKK